MKDISMDVKQSHLLIIIVMGGFILLIGGYTFNVYGHNFAGDESASFLALLDKMQIELNLVNSNLIANNQSLAKDHFNKINELYTENIKKEISEKNERIANEISSIINDTGTAIDNQDQKTSLDDLLKNFNDVSTEAISVRIDSESISNATIQALHFANLIRSIDTAYSTAFDTKPMNMSDMDMSNSGDKMNISNLAAYQTAKELTNTAIDLFSSTIKEHAPLNATEQMNSIEMGLAQLKEVVELKNPYNDAMGIIHGMIHSNTQEIFDLPIK
ncbi:MAG: hypothetical protein ACE5SW_09175 [Nitrososphaeraceae archaeon]